MHLNVSDDLIPARFWRAAEADWPGQDWPGWHAYPDGKLASRSIESAPAAVLRCLSYLAERIPTFDNESFPDFSCYGAGLHELPSGVGLGWHRDAARHPLRPWRRVQTAILYLDGGGDLVFRGESEERVSPQPGRVVTFSGGCEHCVEASQLQRRRSLAVFFYVLNPNAEGTGQAEFL